MLQSNDIWVTVKLSQEDNFTKSTLSIGGILECIEHFFDGKHIFLLLVYCLPHHSISTLPKFLDDLEFA